MNTKQRQSEEYFKEYNECKIFKTTEVIFIVLEKSSQQLKQMLVAYYHLHLLRFMVDHSRDRCQTLLNKNM